MTRLHPSMFLRSLLCFSKRAMGREFSADMLKQVVKPSLDNVVIAPRPCISVVAPSIHRSLHPLHFGNSSMFLAVRFPSARPINAWAALLLDRYAASGTG